VVRRSGAAGGDGRAITNQRRGRRVWRIHCVMRNWPCVTWYSMECPEFGIANRLIPFPATGVPRSG